MQGTETAAVAALSRSSWDDGATNTASVVAWSASDTFAWAIGHFGDFLWRLTDE